PPSKHSKSLMLRDLTIQKNNSPKDPSSTYGDIPFSPCDWQEIEELNAELAVFVQLTSEMEGSSEVDRCNQLIQQEFTRFKAQISTQAATSKPSTSNANPKGSSSASTDSTGLMARLASLNKKKPSAQELQSFLTADLVFKAYGITDWQLPLRWWK
ncbi:hypothetical protein MJO29_008930, partial [Puccinia striiformis f. sp. tritici]